MKQKTISILLSLLFISKCFAEGQDGLGTFIAMVYMLAIVMYTIVGALVLKVIVTILKIKNQESIWFYIAIAFIISLLLALIMGDNFIPFI
jgi:uncharacterized membrane protein YeaQ/YmgE (transglycosylase-associated protein family)